MAILQLHANSPFAVRVGFNDHRSILNALLGEECDGARIPIDLLIVEAHWADRHMDLVREASRGRQLVIDYRVDMWTIDGVAALPANHKQAYSTSELAAAADQIARSALRAQANAIWAMAPACHIENPLDPGWTATIRLLDATLAANGGDIVGRLVGTPGGLATPRAAEAAVTALIDRNVSRVALTVGPVSSATDAQDFLRLVGFLHAAGLSVHVTHQGALGLAALAMGAASFDAGILGQTEAFDHGLQRRRAAGGGYARMPNPRSYAGPLLISIRREVLGQLFQLKTVRAALECDGPCCASRLDGALLHPVTHWSYQRSGQVRSLLDMPIELRTGRVLEYFERSLSLYDTIRAVSKTTREGLSAKDLATLSQRMADVRAGHRSLRGALQSERWAAS